MSELTIRRGIAATLRAMTQFRDQDVTLNDWSVLDGSRDNAPYAIMGISDTIIARQDTKSGVTNYEIPVFLYDKWLDWELSMEAFSVVRQAIIDKFNAVGTARSAGGIEAVSVDVIRTAAPVGFDYGRYVEVNNDESLPQFIVQELIFEVVDYGR